MRSKQSTPKTTHSWRRQYFSLDSQTRLSSCSIEGISRVTIKKANSHSSFSIRAHWTEDRVNRRRAALLLPAVPHNSFIVGWSRMCDLGPELMYACASEVGFPGALVYLTWGFLREKFGGAILYEWRMEKLLKKLWLSPSCQWVGEVDVYF